MVISPEQGYVGHDVDVGADVDVVVAADVIVDGDEHVLDQQYPNLESRHWIRLRLFVHLPQPGQRLWIPKRLWDLVK